MRREVLLKKDQSIAQCASDTGYTLCWHNQRLQLAHTHILTYIRIPHNGTAASNYSHTIIFVNKMAVKGTLSSAPSSWTSSRLGTTSYISRMACFVFCLLSALPLPFFTTANRKFNHSISDLLYLKYACSFIYL